MTPVAPATAATFMALKPSPAFDLTLSNASRADSALATMSMLRVAALAIGPVLQHHHEGGQVAGVLFPEDRRGQAEGHGQLADQPAVAGVVGSAVVCSSGGGTTKAASRSKSAQPMSITAV